MLARKVVETEPGGGVGGGLASGGDDCARPLRGGLRERGYLVFEGFLEADELAAAQDALWPHSRGPREYFVDTAADVVHDTRLAGRRSRLSQVSTPSRVKP
jgi:hypothetical protein